MCVTPCTCNNARKYVSKKVSKTILKCRESSTTTEPTDGVVNNRMNDAFTQTLSLRYIINNFLSIHISLSVRKNFFVTHFAHFLVLPLANKVENIDHNQVWACPSTTLQKCPSP